jgi:succinylglutamic semialdehyde dehydrogenase
VFCQHREAFDEIAYELDAGLINWNRSTVGASSSLPFGGIKQSGNHRPAALLAGLYCAYPQARLLNEPAWSADSLNAAPLNLLLPEDD